MFINQKIKETFLIIGTNLGDRPAHLQQAIAQIEENVGKILHRSSVYETEPWGITDQPSFYNQVLKVATTLNPLQLLTATLAIEKEMGRVRAERYGARIIDIDILFFDDLVINTGELTIPHPRITERNFVLAPLAEIAPHLVHPVLHQTISEIWSAGNDQLGVKKIASNER
ncbi:2-amino-4-hydroxy-6-hydroxymethyldihydropteridine diphosphokinase [Niabella yanshanensis]|uniref:2-amino-4-hydroxy-6-hydroxymethyldihydropteridine pyrophosphokinase n=1 Tax=Niabella yanshanensis TaxID=577386 RepID=A0ABZ0W7T2_9BACT|nr:2-amino-4-hydroxy-6-hydroxymethyldihydropteridine diphosphokinase [Niabella yanshanensis]WQD39348.1 2-amino-4-hydroxy-6-hydroxymethyldihydropteridine diphosphokinase [Niabella yanshanensis]